jgi:hypothetical protein
VQETRRSSRVERRSFPPPAPATRRTSHPGRSVEDKYLAFKAECIRQRFEKRLALLQRRRAA